MSEAGITYEIPASKPAPPPSAYAGQGGAKPAHVRAVRRRTHHQPLREGRTPCGGQPQRAHADVQPARHPAVRRAVDVHQDVAVAAARHFAIYPELRQRIVYGAMANSCRAQTRTERGPQCLAPGPEPYRTPALAVPDPVTSRRESRAPDIWCEAAPDTRRPRDAPRTFSGQSPRCTATAAVRRPSAIPR